MTTTDPTKRAEPMGIELPHVWISAEQLGTVFGGKKRGIQAFVFNYAAGAYMQEMVHVSELANMTSYRDEWRKQHDLLHDMFRAEESDKVTALARVRELELAVSTHLAEHNALARNVYNEYHAIESLSVHEVGQLCLRCSQTAAILEAIITHA